MCNDRQDKDAAMEFFRQFISDNYANCGDRSRLILRSSREIAYALRHTYPLSESEVSEYMHLLDFDTVLLDGQPLWRLYELHDSEV